MKVVSILKAATTNLTAFWQSAHRRRGEVMVPQAEQQPGTAGFVPAMDHADWTHRMTTRAPK